MTTTHVSNSLQHHSREIIIVKNKIPHLCSGQILDSSGLGLDQVITVDSGGHSHLGQAAADELEHRHLGRGILHGHTVGTQSQVSAAAVDLLIVGVIEVAVHDLL